MHSTLLDTGTMSEYVGRFAGTLMRIDVANAADPSTVRYGLGDTPMALAEGRCAHRWLLRLRPGASEELQIAARGHHLRRWEIARDSFSRTREGYHAWRTTLYAFHAAALSEVMAGTGYTFDSLLRVQRLLHKQDIQTDADAQAYEDAVSLAFLELRLAAFIGEVGEEQLLRALRRTWRKMSPAARDLIPTLTLPPIALSALARALA